jgi:hypothetical protein
LVAQVFRAKYFPRKDFLESNIGWRPSFTWRSIWNSKALIQKGLLWQVGTGEHIRIWQDNWIPSNSNTGIYSNFNGLSANATVDEVVAQICSIAISPRSQSDRMRWSGTKNGEFSVSSAYYLAVEGRSRDSDSCSNPVTTNPFWKHLWTLSVPRAVQMFLWRGCNNILPTKEKLYHRKVVFEPFCLQCGAEVESSGHFLWHCPMATAVWAECPRSINKCVISGGDFLSIFQGLSSKLEGKVLELVAITAHKMWNQMNHVVFGGSIMLPRCLMISARESLDAFQQASCIQPVSVVDASATFYKWEKPGSGWIKINWDASVDNAAQVMGVGVVARDFMGRVCASLCTTLSYISDPSTTEALLARMGVDMGGAKF